jgi:hypothetical protein
MTRQDWPHPIPSPSLMERGWGYLQNEAIDARCQGLKPPGSRKKALRARPHQARYHTAASSQPRKGLSVLSQAASAPGDRAVKCVSPEIRSRSGFIISHDTYLPLSGAGVRPSPACYRVVSCSRRSTKPARTSNVASMAAGVVISTPASLSASMGYRDDPASRNER